METIRVETQLRMGNGRGSPSTVVIVINTVYQLGSLQFCFPKNLRRHLPGFSVVAILTRESPVVP